MSRDIKEKVYWGWLNSKNQITVRSFTSIEEIKAKEKEITCRGIFEPFPASNVEEAMEMCLDRYRLQQQEDRDNRERLH